MQVVTLLLLVTCELCLAIRVPPTWDKSASEVKQEIKNDNDEQFSVESFKPQTVNPSAKPIPVEYFEYTAKKPQFAVDIAAFHGVQSPETHYKAYPIKPYTGKVKPELGKHHIFDRENTKHRPLQEFANINDAVGHAVPVSSNYEVFHPYEAETPALQEIYKDPVLNKIRNDLENSKNRLQKYENEAGDANIEKDEYLEAPEKTDNKFYPQRNVPAPYEIHRPQRRPVYYRLGPRYSNREQYLNHRLRHPWNQHFAKIRPVHYRPVKNHIHNLRQSHALKYDDERNEYPQVQIMENYSDPKDGYDIYERGKDKFLQLRDNVDESINKAVLKNRPATYQKLEVQSNDSENSEDDDEDEFIPLKNYAQVRKTETYRHLPRSAAINDAETFDEIRNAPRLREAVKSTKAQTVYSEEGYEDSAYDHAGEQKHASENEGHGGYLKEYELSSGKFKTPSVSNKHEDASGSVLRDQLVHAEKWNEDNKDKKEETEEQDYEEDEHEADGYTDSSNEDPNHRDKREMNVKNETDSDFSTHTDKINETDSEHGVDKREVNFEIPKLDLNSTYLTEQEIFQIAKLKIQPKKDDLKQKYPYYLKNLKAISKHSPLRYAENLKLIPKKSNGGTEFYDSRSNFECLEVDDIPDPIPDKLKKEGHPDDNGDEDDENDSSSKGDENFDTTKKQPRLKGLGDKIDCFKAKYFGENPLDSPFFKEEIISNPEPITLPKLSAYKLNIPGIKEPQIAESKTGDVLNESNVKVENNSDIFSLIEKLRNDRSSLQDSLQKSNDALISILTPPKNNQNFSNIARSPQQSTVYSDVLDNIKSNSKGDVSLEENTPILDTRLKPTNSNSDSNITYRFFQNKEDITMIPPTVRKKRSTSFVYEPYKIIRDSQVQDSKKTTTTSNISPLIRQLQSSRVIDKSIKTNQEAEPTEKHVKRNVNSRVYKDIGKKEREQIGSKNDKGAVDPTFIDVDVDSRRGEPRYEIVRHPNHKSRYTPVENKKSMSIEDYKAQTINEKPSDTKPKAENNIRRQSRLRSATQDTYNTAASNTVRKTVSTTAKPKQVYNKNDSSEADEDYEEYDEDDEQEAATTTTTTKPIFRRRMKQTTTTEKIIEHTERPKLRLVTRFRDYKPDDESEEEERDEKPTTRTRNVKEQPEEAREASEAPKYREKKKKSTKSTLVTDTKRYGEGDDDMRKEEIDALIGVKHDMDDYMPLYEKEEDKKFQGKRHQKSANKDHSRNNDDEEEEDDDDDDDDDDEDDDDDDERIDDKDDDEDDDDEEEEDHEEKEEDEELKARSEITTPEPTKRTLAITTEAPVPTTATHNAKPHSKPIVTRKKIEIHKELPVNKSSPHITQYKQDIKEVEIIKEIPTVSKRKPQKNLEALELYKDDNLAKDINKLGGVEVFKGDIDLKNGPRHGGNYRSAVEESSSAPTVETSTKSLRDAEASQSEYKKHIELDDEVPTNKMHGGNLQAERPKIRTRGRNAKLIELSDVSVRPAMHGGNLKRRGRGRNGEKSQKLIELDDDDHDRHEEDSSSDSRESYSSRNSKPLHGGNYRSAKLVADETKPEVTEKPNRTKVKDGRRNSAAILSSYVQAAPILTTTPAYILDPSKRMYYYVDA